MLQPVSARGTRRGRGSSLYPAAVASGLEPVCAADEPEIDERALRVLMRADLTPRVLFRAGARGGDAKLHACTAGEIGSGGACRCGTNKEPIRNQCGHATSPSLQSVRPAKTGLIAPVAAR